MAIHSDSTASGLPATPTQKIHVAIIMDGNGRWARARGRPRTAGHTIGARTARTIVEHAPSMGIDALTLYAFSSDNWKRPPREVATLMRLFRRYLLSEVDRCVKNGVRLRIVGRRDRLPSELIRAIDGAEAATRNGTTLDLRVAVDYSARDTMVRAAQAYAASVATSGPNGTVPVDLSQAMPLTVDGLGQLLSDVNHGGRARNVDLLVRTGGEQRMSDFLLWECAYAELYFTDKMWPEFTPADLQAAVAEFHGRERRYGGVTEAVAAAG